MTTEPATFDTKAVQLGLPEERATTTGPHISMRHRQKVLSYLRSRTRGATLLAAGRYAGRRLEVGSSIEPTLCRTPRPGAVRSRMSVPRCEAAFTWP